VGYPSTLLGIPSYERGILSFPKDESGCGGEGVEYISILNQSDFRFRISLQFSDFRQLFSDFNETGFATATEKR